MGLRQEEKALEHLGNALSAFLRFELRADDWDAYAVFIVSSGIIGLAIVLLDACLVGIGQKSHFGLTHGPWATPRAALFWVVGSMLGSGLGLLVQVFEPTPLAAVLASMTWRTSLAQLQKLSVHHEQQKPGGQ
jgi:hypothetical protein